MVHTPSNKIAAIRQRVSANKSAPSSTTTTSTFKSGYIPVTDNDSSSSCNEPTTSALDNVQGGSETNLDVILNAISSLGERIKHLEAIPPVLQQANDIEDDPNEESAGDSTGKHWGLSTIKEIRRHYEIGDRLSDGDLVLSQPKLFVIINLVIPYRVKVFLLCEVEKVFLEEGLFDSNFDVACQFIQPFIQSNTFADITEKTRQKKREKAIVKSAISNNSFFS